MANDFTWFDILNQQTKWQNKQELNEWFSGLIGRKAHLLDGAIEGFEDALGFMRRQFASLHFGEPVDLDWLDSQLKTISLGFFHNQGAQPECGSSFPRLRARVKGMHDCDLLRSAKDTLMLQFAWFVSENLSKENEPSVVRCEGMYKVDEGESKVQPSLFPDWIEELWRDEAMQSVRGSEEPESWHRCPFLHSVNSKTKFCSDACRFSTAQLIKPVEEPKLVAADKGRRFRR